VAFITILFHIPNMDNIHTKKVKARRCQSKDTVRIPKVLDTTVEPLFSLPRDLLTSPKSKRKGEELVRRRGKVQKFREDSYTAKRFHEEKFRRLKKINLSYVKFCS